MGSLWKQTVEKADQGIQSYDRLQAPSRNEAMVLPECMCFVDREVRRLSSFFIVPLFTF